MGASRSEKPPPHGTRRRYGKPWNCDCSPCKTANTEYMQNYRGSKPRKQVEHGSRTCYGQGCREPECVQAHNNYQREYMRLYRQGIRLRDPMIEEALR